MAEPARRNAGRAVARLRRNRAAVAGLIVILVLLFAAIFAPFVAPYDPYRVTLEGRLQPPGGAQQGAPFAAERGRSVDRARVARHGERHPGRGGAFVSGTRHPATRSIVGLDAELWHAVLARRELPVHHAWRGHLCDRAGL